MEYNRMVAYIYSYTDGQKCKNTGFAKIEVRQDILKLQINMKGAYSDNNCEWNVNLFYRKNSSIIGVTLGNMVIRNGIGEFRYAGNALNIENSGISFDSIKGLYIEKKSEETDRRKMYASEWDDLGFDPAGILAKDWSKAEGEIMIEFAGEGQSVAPAEEPVLQAAEAESRPVTETVPGTEYSDEEIQKAVCSDEWYEKLAKEKTHVFLFADDELYYIIEITPDDIERLPDTNWGLKNNSFLNHGYFQFRHLILGKIYGGEPQRYFIGVPGIFARRDRNTAAMFGFNHFKFSMRSDVQLSQFGYWYRQLDC